MNEQDQIRNIVNRVPKFLERLKDSSVPGFFHYSLSGDLYPANANWGLGNTVFAIKIYSMLGILDDLSAEDRLVMKNFILSFQKKDGLIFDPLLHKATRLRNVLHAVKHLDFGNIFGEQTRMAETRQSVAVLELLGDEVVIDLCKLPRSLSGVEKYIKSFDWKRPWHAGSHFSHLLFFLKRSSFSDREELIAHAVCVVNEMQSKQNGAWYIGDPSLKEKINGAMKVLTGFEAVEVSDIHRAEKLIDLCLTAASDRHACDKFNVVYVLSCVQEVSGDYRKGEIDAFYGKKFSEYLEFYYPEIGGFSFGKHKANERYYGARISEGKNEPDIHGTVMFLWGLSLIEEKLFEEKILISLFQ